MISNTLDYYTDTTRVTGITLVLHAGIVVGFVESTHPNDDFSEAPYLAHGHDGQFPAHTVTKGVREVIKAHQRVSKEEAAV